MPTMNQKLSQILVASAALLVLGAAAVVVQTRRASGEPASAAAPAPNDPAQLAGLAHARLPSISATPAFDTQSPVSARYNHAVANYLGELTLWLACAGQGEMTLVGTGKPFGEAGDGPPVELTRAAAVCSADPTPVRATFTTSTAYQGMTFRLVDADSAAGRAGFAYRITSDTGKPLTPTDDEANPTTALHLPLDGDPDEDTGYGFGGSIDVDQVHQDTSPLHGRYTLAAACGGIGTLYVQVGKQRVVVKCSWPPVRKDFRLQPFSGPDPKTRLVYRSTSAAGASFALQFLPR